MQKQNNIDEKIAVIVNIAKQLIPQIVKRWWLILIVCLLSGGAGVYYAWTKQPIYTAEMLFTTESEKSGGQLGAYSSLAAQFGVDVGGGGSNSAFEGENLIELLKTRMIIEKTLLSPMPKDNGEQLTIDQYLENHNLKQGWDEKGFSKIKFQKNPPTAERARDSIITAVYNMIIKKQLFVDRKDKKLSFIVIKMLDNNELFAKNFVELLAKNAIEYYVEYRSSKARKNFNLINKQTDSIRGLLYGNIENIAETNDLNVNLNKQRARTSSQKTQVNATANAALYTELLKQLGVAQVSVQRETPLIQIIDKPVLPLLKEKPGRFFTGILFAFVGGILIVFLIIFKKWPLTRKEEVTVAP